MYKNIIKHLFDFITAFLVVLLICPLFIIITIYLTIANNGHPFFIQKRPGKNERIFNIIKFKTMNNKKDAQDHLLPDAERLTAIGKFVRKTSLDELPQLINVLKGDMSLIGPRPLLPEYLEIYDETQKQRHLVRPGITGLAQVKGRNLMKFSERLKNDVYYVDNLSFFLDLKILFWTAKTVFFKSGEIVLGQTVDDIQETEGFLDNIVNGLKAFKKVYGYDSNTFTPPAQQFPMHLESELYNMGIKHIDCPRRLKRYLGNGKYQIVKHNLGDGDLMTVLVRNVVFEPSTSRVTDWVNFSFKQIEAAFFWKKPANISSHRVNFCGILLINSLFILSTIFFNDNSKYRFFFKNY